MISAKPWIAFTGVRSSCSTWRIRSAAPDPAGMAPVPAKTAPQAAGIAAKRCRSASKLGVASSTHSPATAVTPCRLALPLADGLVAAQRGVRGGVEHFAGGQVEPDEQRGKSGSRPR